MRKSRWWPYTFVLSVLILGACTQPTPTPTPTVTPTPVPTSTPTPTPTPITTPKTPLTPVSTPAPDALKVTVTAYQFWWEFTYPELDVVTANELHVPVGVPVSLVLESKDVIHGFWIPKLAGKVDVFPNIGNTMWFQVDEPGTYLGLCTEFCGIGHAHMRFRVIADGPAQFDEWVASQKAPPALPMDPVFGLKGCNTCHTVTGPDAEGVQEGRMQGFLQGQPMYPAPNLTHLASRSTFAGSVENNEENLRRWLRDPGEVKPGNREKDLANLDLNEDEISDLVAYLQKLE